MTALTQNTIEGKLVFVQIQTPSEKYQSKEKEYKWGWGCEHTGMNNSLNNQLKL